MNNLKLGLFHHPFLSIKKTVKNDIINQANSLQSTIVVKEEKKISDQKSPINQQVSAVINQAAIESEAENIIIKNMQIDNVTIKLMQFCWSHSKVNSLK